MRSDQRKIDELREIGFTPDFQIHPSGSILVRFGNTRVICSVSVRDGVPKWMREQNVPGGWLTAEYQMLPGATPERTGRDSSRLRPVGRNLEIQRLIGRSLRAVVDLKKLSSKTFYIDCDVLDADGGTRCAAITGAAVALEIALRKLFLKGAIKEWPMRERVAAVSVGVIDGEVLLDLCYEEDVAAAVDMNVVMTDGDKFVEVQGTAEEAPFSQEEMDRMMKFAKHGLQDIFNLQKKVLKAYTA